jgi:hypothetical protein
MLFQLRFGFLHTWSTIQNQDKTGSKTRWFSTVVFDLEIRLQNHWLHVCEFIDLSAGLRLEEAAANSSI